MDIALEKIEVDAAEMQWARESGYRLVGSIRGKLLWANELCDGVMFIRTYRDSDK
jgi:hypothetical protein